MNDLEVLRQEEEGHQHAEEDQAERQHSPGEVLLAEEPQWQHRRVALHLDDDEGSQQDCGKPERTDDRRR